MAYTADPTMKESADLIDTHLVAATNGVYNVREYGAVGDGTTDDTAAIQSAIDAAVAVGGTVYIPPGIYHTTAALTIGEAVRFGG